VSAGCHSVGGTQWNGQKLGPAPRQCALSNRPCRTAVFGEEPNYSDPPTTLSTRSHSMQLLSLLKAQDQTQRSSFYICRRNSTEYCSTSQSHISRWLLETLPAMTGLLEQAVWAEARCFQGDWVTFYTHPFQYELWPCSRNYLIFPHNTVQHVPISNGMLDNVSAWKHRRCTVVYCSNTEHSAKQRWIQHHKQVMELVDLELQKTSCTNLSCSQSKTKQYHSSASH